MPGKTKSEKGDGAVNRILENANSTRFWVHAYDDDPKKQVAIKSPRKQSCLPYLICAQGNGLDLDNLFIR